MISKSWWTDKFRNTHDAKHQTKAIIYSMLSFRVKRLQIAQIEWNPWIWKHIFIFKTTHIINCWFISGHLGSNDAQLCARNLVMVCCMGSSESRWGKFVMPFIFFQTRSWWWDWMWRIEGRRCGRIGVILLFMSPHKHMYLLLNRVDDGSLHLCNGGSLFFVAKRPNESPPPCNSRFNIAEWHTVKTCCATRLWARKMMMMMLKTRTSPWRFRSCLQHPLVTSLWWWTTGWSMLFGKNCSV